MYKIITVIQIYINLHDMHFPCIKRNEMLFSPVYVDANSNSLNHDTWTIHSTFCNKTMTPICK